MSDERESLVGGDGADGTCGSCGGGEPSNIRRLMAGVVRGDVRALAVLRGSAGTAAPRSTASSRGTLGNASRGARGESASDGQEGSRLEAGGPGPGEAFVLRVPREEAKAMRDLSRQRVHRMLRIGRVVFEACSRGMTPLQVSRAVLGGNWRGDGPRTEKEANRALIYYCHEQRSVMGVRTGDVSRDALLEGGDARDARSGLGWWDFTTQQADIACGICDAEGRETKAWAEQEGGWRKLAFQEYRGLHLAIERRAKEAR